MKFSTSRPYFFFVCLLMASWLSGCTRTPITPTSAPTAILVSAENPWLEKYFQGYSGAFVLYDQANDRYTRYDPTRCAEGLLPASTFKILNSLIGLETGVIPDENYIIQWDGTQYPTSSWNQDHTLKTAIKNSVVWYFQELARRVGKDKMQEYLDEVNYGNLDISGQIDSFWLVGGLRISADEQVEFLKRFYSGDLPFSRRSLEIVKEIIVLEDTPTWRMSGKTGGTQLDGFYVGWFVGYVEEKDNIYFFAANIKGSTPEITGSKAKEITLQILTELGISGP